MLSVVTKATQYMDRGTGMGALAVLKNSRFNAKFTFMAKSTPCIKFVPAPLHMEYAGAGARSRVIQRVRTITTPKKKLDDNV